MPKKKLPKKERGYKPEPAQISVKQEPGTGGVGISVEIMGTGRDLVHMLAVALSRNGGDNPLADLFQDAMRATFMIQDAQDTGAIEIVDILTNQGKEPN